MDYPGKVITKNQVTPTQTSASGNWTLDDAAAATKNNNWPIAGVPNPISKSLRFNSADTAYLNRTFGTPTDNKKWTWSGWVKRSALGARQAFMATTNAFGAFGFTDTDNLWLALNNGSAANINTTAVYRDVSSYYHVVFVVDTTQATSTNRVKIYVNGSQITAFSGSPVYPTLNYNGEINSATVHNIGCYAPGAAWFLSAYLTEVNFIDGQALTPSDFGLTNPQTGQWIPKKYTGTYGTNGFYLNFKDATSTTTLGYDYSGNANNWTTNNFSVTAGAGNDSLTDVPTPWVAYNTTGDVGGVVRGNYCTWNPLSKNSNITTSNGNLEAVNSSADWYNAKATIGASSGKWYWECVLTSGIYAHFGIATDTANVTGYQITGVWSYGNDGSKVVNGTRTAGWGATFTTNDIIGVAFNADDGTLTVYKNNVSQGTLATGLTSGPYFPFASIYQSTATINFGQRPFAYTPPAGFLSLCSTNLPTPTIGFGLTNQGDDYFDVSLYTGNGTAIASGGKVISGVSFQPDFVWIKSRTQGTTNYTGYHNLYDAVRGANKYLTSSTTEAESTLTQGLASFNSDGFTVGSVSSSNYNGDSFVSWNWKANGAGSTNTAGSITSTVSANTTSGFSIVTYTGTGANATVGHGIGTAPQMIIIKNRQAANSWVVYHVSIGNGNVLLLNSTNASTADSTAWNTTTPTSTVFSLGSGAAADTNQTSGGGQHVAYCFAPVAGYSAFGSYTGNGSTDGPFVFCGFRPRYVLIKQSSTGTASWYVIDTARSPYNVTNAYLLPNASNQEATDLSWDILSNGFKLRDTYSQINTNGSTYIYAAFAESPFKFANAR